MFYRKIKKHKCVLNNYGFCADFCKVCHGHNSGFARRPQISIERHRQTAEQKQKMEDKELHSIRYGKQKRNSGIKSNVHYDDIHNRKIRERSFSQ